MTHGLSIHNESGEVAGSRFPNLFYKGGGTLTFPGTTQYLRFNKLPPSGPAQNHDLVGLPLPNYQEGNLYFFKSSVPVAVYNNKVFVRVKSSERIGYDEWVWGSATIEYKVFGPPGASGGGYGLEAYNDGGQVTYTTQERILRPAAFLSSTKQSLDYDYGGSTIWPLQVLDVTEAKAVPPGVYGICPLNSRLYWGSFGNRYGSGYNVKEFQYIIASYIAPAGDWRISQVLCGGREFYSGSRGRTHKLVNSDPNTALVINWNDYQ